MKAVRVSQRAVGSAPQIPREEKRLMERELTGEKQERVREKAQVEAAAIGAEKAVAALPGAGVRVLPEGTGANPCRRSSRLGRD